MEWIWVLLLAAPLLGPILWALVRGRGRREPGHEEALDSTGYGALTKDRNRADLFGNNRNVG